jgi:hypothetical protein
MAKNEKIRAEFMTAGQRSLLFGSVPRTHRNCLTAVKVARPGKTAQDKYRGVWSTQNSRHGVRLEEKKK